VAADWRGVAIDAVPTDDGWALLAVGQKGTLFVEDLDRVGHVTRTAAVPRALGNVVPGQALANTWRLSNARQNDYVEHIRSPIAFAKVHTHTTSSVHYAWQAITDAGDTIDLRLPKWVASPIVVLDQEFAVSLADLGSDLRVLIRTDSIGRIVHASTLRVPIGLMAASQETRQIAFVRDLDRTEVVVYRYAWKGSK
jgi:hypothetical protein